jgi:hypothetical protein
VKHTSQIIFFYFMQFTPSISGMAVRYCFWRCCVDLFWAECPPANDCNTVRISDCLDSTNASRCLQWLLFYNILMDVFELFINSSFKQFYLLHVLPSNTPIHFRYHIIASSLVSEQKFILDTTVMMDICLNSCCFPKMESTVLSILQSRKSNLRITVTNPALLMPVGLGKHEDYYLSDWYQKHRRALRWCV